MSSLQATPANAVAVNRAMFSRSGTGFAAALTLLATISCANALASATSDEYVQCHEIATSALLRCLNQEINGDDEACWREARQMKNACYKTVKDRYRRDPEKIEKEKRAREEAAQRARDASLHDNP